MSFNPWDHDDPIRKIMRDMEQLRRMADPYSDSLRQARGQGELLRQTDILGEIKRDVVNKIELQRSEEQALLRAFEEGREISRQLEQRQDLQTAALSIPPYEEALREAAAASDIFSRYQDLVNGYIFRTFYGTGILTLGPSTGSSSFQQTNEELAESYEQVNESVESDESDQPSAKSMSTVEAFASAEVVEELAEPVEERSKEEAEGETEDRESRRQIRRELQHQGHHQLRPALQALEPKLVNIWEGGTLALSGSNPDRVRHFSASRRELTTHILHLLAPDEAVRKWNADPGFYHNGRPTRMARLRYICRSIAQESFKDFVHIDFKLMLETLDVFQQGTHALEPKFTPQQLDALSTRADQHLLFLLQLGALQN